MKTISIKLEEDLDNKITYLSKEKGVFKSMLVREALVEYLSNSEAKSKSSFSAFARDLSGSLEGPTDLSTNPKYLEGFGN
ncbi:MAG: ribbon-helix-helix domain-containing protein [Melioribacteraceae bacterium]|nr:ribbon-helix-helix domain-containing protein [Melioribacteraceae bacterium]